MRRELIPLFEDPNDPFLSEGSWHDIGRCRDTHYVYSVRKWQNGARGAIVDWYDINEEIDSEGKSLFVKEGGRNFGHRDSLQFVRSEIDLVSMQDAYPGVSDIDMWKECPLVAEGFIARFVKTDLTDIDYPALFEAYYKMEKAFYFRERRMVDPFSFRANLKDEFANHYHLEQEQENIKYSLRHLLPFLRKKEHGIIEYVAKAYIAFVESKKTKTTQIPYSDYCNNVEPQNNDEDERPPHDNPPTEAIECPPNLSNKIFREVNEHDDAIDMKKLWYWIYNNLVCKISASYEWLSLFLFAKGHNLLKVDVTAKSFCDQMSTWFEEKYSKKCSYDQVTAYLTGFFSGENFHYREWVNGDGILPENWTPNNKNQRKEGYTRIHLHCKRMEKNFKFSDITIKGTNR